MRDCARRGCTRAGLQPGTSLVSEQVNSFAAANTDDQILPSRLTRHFAGHLSLLHDPDDWTPSLLPSPEHANATDRIARKQRRVTRERLRRATGQAAILALGGCSASPVQNLLGSFFPAWMLCAVAGIASAIVLRQALGVLGISQYLIVPPLTYLCVAVAGTLLVWLVWFGH